MFSSSLLAVTLATLSLAMPNPVSEVQARSDIVARSCESGANGAVIFSDTNGNNGIGALKDFPSYCQQFQPIYPTGYNLTGYASGGLVLKFYKNANCAGTPALTVSKANNNEVNGHVNLGVVYSFQTQFLCS